MTRPSRATWLWGNAIALIAFGLIASHWWVDGQLARTVHGRGLAAYVNAAGTLPILLLSEVGRLLIAGFAGLVHLVAIARGVWRRDWLAVALVAVTLVCWVVAAQVTGLAIFR